MLNRKIIYLWKNDRRKSWYSRRQKCTNTTIYIVNFIVIIGMNRFRGNSNNNNSNKN